MTAYRTAKSNRTHSITHILLAAIAAALIATITACSREEPPSTSRPQRVDPSPMQTIEAMASQMAALQTQAAEPGDTAADDEPRPTENSATAVAPATETPEPIRAEPTESPTPAATEKPTPAILAIPTPTGEGICGRSPTVQEAILLTLRTSSCRYVTTDELYRIQCFRNLKGNCTTPKWSWSEEGPKQGDFAGLVNLQKLTIAGDFTLEEGTFAGSAIERLNLNVKAVTPRAFSGSAIDELDLTVEEITPGALQDAPITKMKLRTNKFPPKGSLPSTLTLLHLTTVAPPFAIQPDLLEELTQLEWLFLNITPHKDSQEFRNRNPGHTPTPEDYIATLPTGFFDANTRLKGIIITTPDRDLSTPRQPDYLFHMDTYHWKPRREDETISAHTSLLANLPNLEILGISNLKPRGHISGSPPLTLHPESPLHEILTDTGISDDEDTLTDGERAERAHQGNQRGRWKGWKYGAPIGIKTHDSDFPF